MSLLQEYAITPDVFDTTSYSSDEIGRHHLQYLKEAFLADGLVRNLHNGDWLEVFRDPSRPWHMRAKELLKKLVTQKRLRIVPPARPTNPSNDTEWCQEALDSHRHNSLAGIISTRAVADNFTDENLVASVDALAIAPWWSNRSPSIRLDRTSVDYQKHLKLILRCSNSVLFIDPHIDPAESRYDSIKELLRLMAGRVPAPLLEIHRVCYVGSGKSRQIPSNPDWEKRFGNSLSPTLISGNLSVEVFIWDDIHDRYLITDLIGINLPNGFDTTPKIGTRRTTWSRLGRAERDDVQREFDPAAPIHVLRHRFTI